MIVMMFDAHKLDISDEFTAAITTLKPHQDKIRYTLWLKPAANLFIISLDCWLAY